MLRFLTVLSTQSTEILSDADLENTSVYFPPRAVPVA